MTVIEIAEAVIALLTRKDQTTEQKKAACKLGWEVLDMLENS